jgi:nicotinamide-nucleotide adenylyltransferase
VEKIVKAIFLGRFQPFHKGHHHTVEKFKGRFEQFQIVIGSSTKFRKNQNPLRFNERKEIIRSCHPDLEITGLEDEDKGSEGHREWVNRLIRNTETDKVITRNELVKEIIREYSEAEVVEHKLYRPEKYSGTNIRGKIREGKPWKELVPSCCRKEIIELSDKI